MKRLLLLLLLMCSASAWAQDVIVKRDGTAVACRIINVSSLEIVYKAWNNQQGPNLVMNVADVQVITYENGDRKTFENKTPQTNTDEVTSTPQMQKTIRQQMVGDDELLMMAKRPELMQQSKERRLKLIGVIGGPILIAGGIAMTLLGKVGVDETHIVGNTTYGDDTDWALLGPGIVMLAGGIATTSACLIRANKLKRQAFQLSVQTTPLYQHDFSLKNGTSLSAGVDILKDNTRRNATLGIGLSYNF